MSSLPNWAKLVGSTVIGMLVILGAFVTRVEYSAQRDETAAQLEEMRRDIKLILWRVGGREGLGDAAQVDATTIPCLRETELNATTGRALDDLWRTAQTAAKMKATVPRPRFCFSPYPIILIDPNGELGRLYGLYNPANNTVLLAVTADEPELLRCAVIHEMLHAILGPGHKHTGEALARVQCGAD